MNDGRRVDADSAGNPGGSRRRDLAIEAHGFLETRGAVGADGLRGKGVKGLLTLSTDPVGSERRRGAATGTGIALAAGKLGNLEQSACVLKAAPAIHQE